MATQLRCNCGGVYQWDAVHYRCRQCEDTITDNELWAKQRPPVWKYVSLRESKKNKISLIKGFFTWLEYQNTEAGGMEPGELIQLHLDKRYQALEQRNPALEYYVPELIKEYILSKRHLRTGSKQNIISSLYNLFEANKVPLPRDPELQRAAKKGSTPPVNKSQWVDLEGLQHYRSMIEGNMNRMYVSALLLMNTAGMGQDEVVEFSNQGYLSCMEKLEKGLNDTSIIKIHLKARKDLDESNDYHTYIFARDALQALENWLQERARFKESWTRKTGQDFEETAEEALYVTRRATPLTTNALTAYWSYRSKALGIVEQKRGADSSHRTGWSTHIGRRFFKTWGYKTPAPNWIWDAMMGHVVDDNNYLELFNDDAYMVQQLQVAEPWFNLLSSPVPFDLESRFEVEKREKALELRLENVESKVQEYEAALREIKKMRDYREQIEDT